MPPDRVVYDAVLDAAGDVARADNALEAELLASAMLGSVYAMAETDRLLMVREFVGNFLAGTARRRSAVAVAVRAAFAALVPDAPGAGEVAPGPQAPPWVGQLGRVRPTGAYAYGDVYGDQTSYLVTFAYEEDAGGPEHVVVVLVDHNLGAVKDLFVGSATEVVAQARQLCASDDLVWFEDSVPVERVRAEVDRHLAYTDSLEVLPPEDSLAEDRAVVGARLALLPAGDGGPAPDDAPDRLDDAARAALADDFLASPEAAAAGLTDAGDPSLKFGLSLIIDHAETFPTVDVLRWSPTLVEMFLLDWVHRRAVLDDADAAVLPRALRAWVAYAARRRGVPAAAAELTVAAVDEIAPEFARVHASGERRSPATDAVTRLLAEGVDPADPDAVNAWIQANSGNN